MKILIATPAYGDRIHRGYHESVAGLVSVFAERFGFTGFEQKIIDVPVLATARNILASIVLDDDSYSHLLFVDADMAFAPTLVARMLAFRRPLIGSIYPVKTTDPQALAAAFTDERTTMQAQLVAARYVCDREVISEIHPGGRLVTRIVDGFVRTHLSGTGVMLIERDVFVKLKAAHPELWVEEPGAQIRRWGLERGGLLQCFDALANEEGYLVSEDIAFCTRWTATGGEIWSAVDEAIVHSGTARFQGHALIHLRTSGTVRVKERGRRSKGRGDDWFRRALAEG